MSHNELLFSTISSTPEQYPASISIFYNTTRKVNLFGGYSVYILTILFSE